MSYRKLIGASFALLMALAITVPVFALHSPEHYSLFGDAIYVSPGNASSRAVKLTSDAAPGYGGVDYGVESGLTFAELTTLSTDYRPESDDTCTNGSPRFQINVVDPVTGDEGNIFAYIGPEPNYTGCVGGVWSNSGDLLEVNKLLDTTQLDAGAFYDPYVTAVVKYGEYTVTGIQLVTDAGYAFPDGEQAIDADNTLINSTLFTYEVPVAQNKDECKNEGWRNLTDNEGNSFRNQGQCVSYTNQQNNNNNN